jgi:hypothetical protein
MATDNFETKSKLIKPNGEPKKMLRCDVPELVVAAESDCLNKEPGQPLRVS